MHRCPGSRTGTKSALPGTESAGRKRMGTLESTVSGETRKWRRPGLLQDVVLSLQDRMSGLSRHHHATSGMHRTSQQAPLWSPQWMLPWAHCVTWRHGAPCSHHPACLWRPSGHPGHDRVQDDDETTAPQCWCTRPLMAAPTHRGSLDSPHAGNCGWVWTGLAPLGSWSPGPDLGDYESQPQLILPVFKFSKETFVQVRASGILKCSNKLCRRQSPRVPRNKHQRSALRAYHQEPHHTPVRRHRAPPLLQAAANTGQAPSMGLQASS